MTPIDSSRYAIDRGDLFGGLTAGIVALPLCLAFGVASGLGPAAGLYGGIIVGMFAAMLGGTAVQVSGPTAPMTLVAAAVVLSNTSPDGKIDLPFVFGVFFLAGALQITFGVLRLGKYIRFLPYPVLSGLMTGIGVIIVIQQIFPLLGQAAPSSNPVTIIGSLDQLPGNINPSAVLLSAATLAALFLVPKVRKNVPPSLIALVVLTPMAVLLGLSAPVIGSIPSGLPDFALPNFDSARIGPMLTTALQLAFLGSIDSLTTSLVADNITKTHHNSDQELVGQGVGNMAASLFGGIPGAGAFMRTAINIKAGGRHRSSGVIHALFLLAVMLGLSGAVKYIPHAILAGILVAAGLSIIDYRSLKHFRSAPRADSFVMVLVILLTILTDLVTSVAAGMIVSSFIFMAKVARLSERDTELLSATDESWPDELQIPEEIRQCVVMKRVTGPLFFGFANTFRNLAPRTSKGNILVLCMDKVAYIDQSGAYALQDVLIDLKAAGWQVLVVGLRKELVDLLSSLHVIPALISDEDSFERIEDLEHVLKVS